MSVDDNPYAPPKTSARAVGVRSGRVEDLKSVAVAQKAVITCIALYLAAIIGQFLIPLEYRLYLLIGVLVLGLVAMVSVIMLAMKVYNPVTGIIFGLGIIIPCFGLILLFVINQKATKVLQLNGHHVGFFGADLSKF
jgi:hypothetical protein